MNRQLLLGAALLTSICAIAMRAQDTPAASAKALKRPADAKPSGEEDQQGDGERVFARRCSSCHNAPEGFSPRISGTVVRHMRVRANLSRHEEEALLRFFNP